MLSEAEEVIHDRAVVACEAATMAGLPGTFHAWREDGLLAVLATAPELRFLRTISGVTEANLAQAVRLATASCDPRIRRSLLIEGGVPVSAAALSSHGSGVLLGGSATPREHRGKGAQARLVWR